MADFGPALIVVDPASVAAAVNPSDGAGVRAFLAGLTGEADRIGAGVLILAHDTKGARNEIAGGIRPRPRHGRRELPMVRRRAGGAPPVGRRPR
ncbi:MAG: hypothetical protein J4F34_09475 [Gemmatimonadetes bacterium]|nr:hypothetical protein [Gemmatimonadota bacterium]